MSRRSARAGIISLLLAATGLTPAVWAAPAPQNVCDGPFCASVDLTTYDAGAPTQTTTAAGQPVNLGVQVTDTSSTVATDPARWLDRAILRLGTTAAKSMTVTDPASLPIGSYLAGSVATAGSCAPGTDGSGYATSCPAGHGSGYVQLTPLIGSPTIAPFTFGVQSVTTGLGGAVAANLSIWIPGTTLLLPLTGKRAHHSTFAATATAGPRLKMSLQLDLQPPPYQPSPASLTDLGLTLNGLVGQTAFLRHSLTCTDVTSSVQVSARGTQSVLAPVTQTISGCPAAPRLPLSRRSPVSRSRSLSPRRRPPPPSPAERPPSSGSSS